MITVKASDFSKNFDRYRDLAQREIVAVTDDAQVTGYFVSRHEYEDYLRVKAAMTQAFAVEEMPEETVLALMETRMDPRHNHLNALMDG